MKETAIFINQIGYLPADKKIAFVTGSCKGDTDSFSLINSENNEVVYTGKLTATPEDITVGESIYSADFSSIQTPGAYFVCINGKNSFNFTIAENVYNQVFNLTLNYFTDSRCGQNICHTGTAEIYGTNKTKNVQGGWHDAGDYGRYVVAGTKAVMDLLLAYDFVHDSNNSFDILAEVRFELEWLLQMQREDGAVYHKISCYNFPKFVLPQDEKEKLVLSPVSTAATADFAGCLAYASKYFSKSDKKFSDLLLQSALKAQNYLFAHEDEFYFNPPEITTGGYGDRDVSDERYFAFCSLFAATGDKNYLTHALKIREIKKHEKPDSDHPIRYGWLEGYGWPFVTGYGTEILLQNLDKIQDDEIIADLKFTFMSAADLIMKQYEKSSFGYCSKHIFWGSNGAVCDLAHVLIIAYKLSGEKKYLDASKAQINYILGCNPVNYCYVTCTGTKSPVHPHHRPSGARKMVYPGMLVGGPCAGLHDAYAKEHLQNTPGLKCYVDVVQSYSTNEVAIYWNSAFVYLLAALLSL